MPINVTAVSAEEIRDARIETPRDLMSQVPNFDVKDNIPGAQQIITIRGVGLDDFSSTNNSTVGIYVDDIYLASFAEQDFNFFDLDHIEVLKGPQATLYGRNATAGAINIISAKPEFGDLAGNISAGYGNYEAFQADGMINVPVTDNFALRFAGETIQQNEGYWYSRMLNEDLGKQDIYLGRAQALWDPTSSLTVLLKLEGEHNHSQIGVGKFFGTISTVPGESCPDFSNPAHCVDTHGYTDTSSDPFKGDWNHPAPYDVDRWNATLHVTDDLGWATLTSVTGYIGFRRGFYIDADATPYVDSEFDQNDKVNQFSQEVRLDGTAAGGVTWLVGADYAWDHVQTYSPGYLGDLFGLDTLITADQVTHYAAGFAQVDWPLFDQVTLSSGVRLAYEDRHYEGGSSWTVAGTSIPFAPFDTYLRRHDRRSQRRFPRIAQLETHDGFARLCGRFARHQERRFLQRHLDERGGAPAVQARDADRLRGRREIEPVRRYAARRQQRVLLRLSRSAGADLHQCRRGLADQAQQHPEGDRLRS